MEITLSDFIIYGYVVPLLIMLVWMSWRICSYLKAGEWFASRFMKDCWPLLIPGISLWGVCALLMIAMVAFKHWTERHLGRI
jgi:hypothetical protein